MSMTISIRVAHKSPSLAKGQRHHDMRKSHVPDYVDKARSDSNSVIIEPQLEAFLRAVCEERRGLRNTKRAMKKDAAVATVGIITFGTEAQPVIEALSVAEQDALYLKAAKALAERLNTDLTGLVIHRDESAPHAHLQMPAYDFTGKPLSKVITPAVAKELQDIVGRVYGECGISRGKPKSERIADGEDYSRTVHRTVNELHKDLPVELAELTKKLTDLQSKIVQYERLSEKSRNDLSESVERESQLKKRLEVYEKRIADADAKAKSLEADMIKLLNAETRSPSRPEMQNVDIKTGVFSRETREVLSKNAFLAFARDAENQAHTLARLAVVAHTRARQAEDREQKLLNNPEVVSALKKQMENAVVSNAVKREMAQPRNAKAKSKSDFVPF